MLDMRQFSKSSIVIRWLLIFSGIFIIQHRLDLAFRKLCFQKKVTVNQLRQRANCVRHKRKSFLQRVYRVHFSWYSTKAIFSRYNAGARTSSCKFHPEFDRPWDTELMHFFNFQSAIWHCLNHYAYEDATFLAERLFTEGKSFFVKPRCISTKRVFEFHSEHRRKSFSVGHMLFPKRSDLSSIWHPTETRQQFTRESISSRQVLPSIRKVSKLQNL